MKRIAISRPALPVWPIEGGCHCDDSKRLSGGPFALYLHVGKGPLETLSEPRGRFIRTGGSGNAIPIERCALRGKRMCHLPEAAPDLVILCAATLDESRSAIPAPQISTEYAAADAAAAGAVGAVQRDLSGGH